MGVDINELQKIDLDKGYTVKKDGTKFKKDIVKRCLTCGNRFTARFVGNHYEQKYCSIACIDKQGKGGRPTKLTDDVVQKLEATLQIDGTIQEACLVAGISERTFYRWYLMFKDFKQKMDSAEIFMTVKAKETWRKAILDGDAKASVEFLKRRKKDRYSERIEQKVEGGLDISDTKRTSDMLDELKKIVDKSHREGNNTNETNNTSGDTSDTAGS